MLLKLKMETYLHTNFIFTIKKNNFIFEIKRYGKTHIIVVSQLGKTAKAKSFGKNCSILGL